MVEDRRIPSVDRSKTVPSKTAGGAKNSVKASPQKTANRKETEKLQREERQAAKQDAGPGAKNAKDTKDAPGAQAIADAMSSDQVLEMKPERFSSGSLR